MANRVCTDTNECSSGTHQCSQICINKAGGYICDCHVGYELSANKRSCLDIDECQLSNGGCDHKCTNFYGSYKCLCKKGYLLLSDRMRCQDINECMISRPCDFFYGKCINRAGGYECGCKKGYELQYDKKTCKDINECKGINYCQQSCVNRDGSYLCSCRFGYKLKPDGRTCEDIDECKENLHTCEHICENNPGSFKCRCRPGFILDADGNTCIGLPCKTLYAPHHGSVNCTGFYVGDRCYFGCNVGFELQGVGMRTCLQKSRWTSGEPKCIAMQCPAAKPPVNGVLILPCIEEYRSKCIVKCKQGYDLKGKNTIDCDINAGITKWRLNSTCKEIRLCTPNPCQHKGSCQVISNTKYSCDCTNTGYVGDQCQIGELKVPEFPQMQVAIESDELVIKAKPDIQLTITLDTELPDSVVFTPSNTLQIVAPRDEVTFKVTPKRKGLIRIKYVLSGADSFSFVQPRDGVIYALESVTNNRLSSIPGDNFMKDNCHDLHVDKCPGPDNIKLSSSCRWEVFGTTGYVSVSTGSISLPLSLTGVSFLANEGIKKFHSSGVLTVAKETQDMLISGRTSCASGKTCTNAIKSELDHEFLLKRSQFLRFFYKSVMSINPWWITYDLTTDHNGFHVNDVQSLLIQKPRMRDLIVCKHIPSSISGTSSVLVTHAPVNIAMATQEYVIDSSHPTCVVVDLCKQISYISLPVDKSLTPSHGLSSIRIKIKGLGFSNKSVIEDSCMRFWNGVTGKEMQLCVQAKVWLKAFINLNTDNSNLAFNGEVFSTPANMESFVTERFNMEHNMLLRGELSGKLAINVHGKKLNLVYPSAKVSSYVQFGGTLHPSCMLCSTKGIYLSMLATKLNIDYETSVLRIYPDLNIQNAKVQARLYYDVIKGHVILVENLPRIKLMLRFLANSISAQIRGIQFAMRPLAAKYMFELGGLTKASATFSMLLQKGTLVVSIADPKYKDVFVALTSAKQYVATFIDSLVALKDAVHSIEVNPFVIRRVDMQVLNLRRTMNRLLMLQAVPKLAAMQERFDGLSVSYVGKVCVFNLCFDNGVVSVYDLKRDQSSCSECWNTSRSKLSEYTYIDTVSKAPKQLGSYVQVKSGTKVKMEVSKTSDKFVIELPATVAMFDQLFEVLVRIDNKMISYTLKNVSIAQDIVFDIKAKADFSASITWNTIKFTYEGQASASSKLASKMETLANTMIKNIALRTIRRINETRFKLSQSNTLIEKNKAEVSKLKADADAKNRERRLATAQYLQYNLNYTKTLKSFREYFVGDFIKKLEKRLNETCMYEKCSEVCFTMSLYDMCQDKQFVIANELRCDQKQVKTRTTVEEPFKTDCAMTKHNFIPIYTGTCRKGGQAKLKNSLMATGAGVGGLVGSIIPGIGTAIGSVVGTAVGYFASLFSSCDESYEVFKQVINYQQPCVLKKYNTRTKLFTVSDCFPVQRLVLSDYGVPYPCPVSNSTCVPIIDPVCTQKNNECKRNRDTVRTRELKKAGVYNDTWFKLNFFEIKMQEQFILMEKAKSVAAEAQRKYERKEALLKEAKLEAKFAQLTIDNIDLTLSFEKCLLGIYQATAAKDKAVEFTYYSFKTSTPIAENLLFEFYVKGGKTGKILAEFLFTFHDQDISIQNGVRKIIQQYLCSGKTKRRRRSIVESISSSPLGHHNDFYFATSVGKDVKDSDAVCLSSKTIFSYLSHLIKELTKSVALNLQREKELKHSLGESNKVITNLQSRETDPLVKKQLEWLRETHAEGVAELKEYSAENVVQKWQLDMELYTQSSNFTACLDANDCVETALENLKELPSMFKGTRSQYVKLIEDFMVNYATLFKTHTSLEALQRLNKKLENVLGALKDMTHFCSRVPQVRLTSPTQVISFVGDIVELECKATSPLPISYIWKFDNKTLLFETQPKLKIFMHTSAFGKYRCEVWNLAGRNRSDDTFIVLRKKPVIVSQPEDFVYLSTVASKISPFFECNVTADPQAKITWYYQSYGSQSQSLKLHSTKCVLRIASPTASNSGFYYCVAINQYGSTTSRKARLDVLRGDVPHQEVSVEFDLGLGRIDKVNRTEYTEKIIKDSKLSVQQSVHVDMQAVGSADVKFEVKLEDKSNDNSYGLNDVKLIRSVSKKRQSLSEGVQRLVSGFVDTKGKVTAAEMEKTMVLGFNGDKCPTGSKLHNNGFTCVPCTAGSYGYAGFCLPCPIGTYQALPGQDKCNLCSDTQVTEQTNTINKMHCESPVLRAMDIILLVDTSQSQSLTQFDNIRQFLVKFHKDFVQSGDDVRFGLITFSNSVNSVISLAYPNSAAIATINNLSRSTSAVRKTDKAIKFASRIFSEKSSVARRKLLVSIITGRTSSLNNQEGFVLLRQASLDLHRGGIESVAVGIGGFDKTELLALASAKKENNMLEFDNAVKLDNARQKLAATILRGECSIPGKDIAIAIQSSSTVPDKLWSNVLSFVGGFINRLRNTPTTKFGIVTFASKVVGKRFRRYDSPAEVNAVLSGLARTKGVHFPHALEFMFNSFTTEKYGSLSKVKILLIISEQKIKDDVFAKFQKFYHQGDVRFINVIMSLEKQDVGVADLGMEESEKFIYSLGELAELVKRVKGIVPTIQVECFKSHQEAI